MGWETSDRRFRLPRDWGQRRRVVLARCGYQCEHVDSQGLRCVDRAVEVDHVERGDDHSLENLQGLCAWHHRRKTVGEATEARRLARERARQAVRDSHPGMALKRSEGHMDPPGTT